MTIPPVIPLWNTEVSEIRSFLDESYSYPISGRSFVSANYSTRLPWARIGVEKFVDRIIPHLTNSNDYAEAAITPIMEMVKNAVAFGNGTIMILKDGKVRVCLPEIGQAKIDSFGRISYLEEQEGRDIVGIDGDVYFHWIENGERVFEPTGAKFFSIFYNADDAAPSGRSRISPSIRANIRSASRNKKRLEEIAHNHAIPKRLFNGVWEGLDSSVVEGIGKINSGATDVLGLPVNPITGDKISIDEFSAADIQPFLDIHTSLAKDVAAAFNVDPSEFGATTPQNISSDALYASKEDLILEISAFERSIKQTVQSALNCLCERNGQEKVELNWLEPATPSKAAQADAFVKLAAVIPGLQYSRKALAWAGLSSEVIDDIITDMELPEPSENPNLEASSEIIVGDEDENRLF